jgi:lipopolysaccharide export system protein LptA
MSVFYILTKFRHKIQVICILCLFPLFLNAQNVQNVQKVNAQSLSVNTQNPTVVSSKQAKASVVKTAVKVPARKVFKRSNSKVKKVDAQAKKQLTPQQQFDQLLLAQQNLKKSLAPRKQLYMEHSDQLSYDAETNFDYKILSGNVRFRHEGAFLYCDSAHFYQKSNSLYAYGNVHMEQGDTLFLYGAWLYYDGNSKLAMVREKVRLENRMKNNKVVTLFTDSLNYDRVTNIGYFFDGGLMVDEINELSSEYGQYCPDTKMAEFQNDVKLVHPKFVMTNQELRYNTQTGVANIVSPTEIVADSAYVYSEDGWYDTRNDKSELFKQSYIISDHRRLTGDTIHYDKKNGIGEAFGHVVMRDSTQQITFKGGYGYSEEKTNYALLSKNALMIEHSTKDTLFLHADTLITRQDSIYKAVTAFHGVRFYRFDVQGLCDSLYYSTRDSVLSFYTNPVLWSDKQQLSGDFMQLYSKNSKPDYLHIQKAAMVISQESDSLYNQSSGKDLIAYFDSGQVVRVEIKGNAETVYLPRDEKTSELIGLNRLEGSSLTVWMRDKKMQKILVWPQPKGKFYPIAMLAPEARYLSNYAWYNDLRPTSPFDIFRDVPFPKSSNVKSLKGRNSESASSLGIDELKSAKNQEKK